MRAPPALSTAPRGLSESDMVPKLPHEKSPRAARPVLSGAEPFAEQLKLSRVHTRLVPMRRSSVGYSIEPAAADWFELPVSRGFAGYGLARALRLLLDAMSGLSALHETLSASGEPFAHGEFAPLQFRVDPIGVCRLVPLTTRHYVSDAVAPPRAVLGFLSPERLIAEKVGVRADVFSAGVLLWEALAGRRLSEAQSSETIIERLLSQRLTVPSLPPQLAWATPLKVEVERALSVNQQRFADCAEFSAAILGIAADHVAKHAEIAELFATNLEPSPSPPASTVPASRERLSVVRGATLRMLPEQLPTSSSAEANGSRRGTLKMNVTLRMPRSVSPPPRSVSPPPLPPPPPRSARAAASVSEFPSTPLFRLIAPRAKPLPASSTLSTLSPLRRSTPPPLPMLTPPASMRHLTPMTLPSLQPATLPPQSTRPTPPPLPVMAAPSPPPSETETIAIASPVLAFVSPGSIAPTAGPIEPPITLDAPLRASALGARRRWLAAALLTGAILAGGIVASRLARSATALGHLSPLRSISAPFAPPARSSSFPGDAPKVGDAAENEAPSPGDAAMTPTPERPAGPPASAAPSARGRAPMAAPARARDYGI